jgi:hypothetical protein
MDRMNTTATAVKIKNSSVVGCRGTTGAYTRAKEPCAVLSAEQLRATIVVATTEPEKGATLDDCKIRR